MAPPRAFLIKKAAGGEPDSPRSVLDEAVSPSSGSEEAGGVGADSHVWRGRGARGEGRGGRSKSEVLGRIDFRSTTAAVSPEKDGEGRDVVSERSGRRERLGEGQKRSKSSGRAAEEEKEKEKEKERAGGWAGRLWGRWRKEPPPPLAAAPKVPATAEKGVPSAKHLRQFGFSWGLGCGAEADFLNGEHLDSPEQRNAELQKNRFHSGEKPALRRSYTSFGLLGERGKGTPAVRGPLSSVSGPLVLPTGKGTANGVQMGIGGPSSKNVVSPAGEERSVGGGENAEKFSYFVEPSSADYGELVRCLKGGGKEKEREKKREAARVVRVLARTSPEARVKFADAGAIPPLLALMEGEDMEGVENAALALCNLAIGNARNKETMVKGGAIQRLVELLRCPVLPAREAAVAVLLTLAAGEEHKAVIGEAGGIPLIVNLLSFGTAQGRCDAAHALYNLVGCECNRSKVLSAKPIPGLLGVLEASPEIQAAEKAVAVIYTLTAVEEGRVALVEAPTAVRGLRAEIERGSERGREVAVSALLAACAQSRKFCHLAVELIPVLMQLTAVESSTRLRVKVKQLLKYLEKPGSAPIVMVSAPRKLEIPQRAASSSLSLSPAGSASPQSPSSPGLLRRGHEEFMSESVVVREMANESMRGAMKQIKLRAKLGVEGRCT